MYNPLIFHSFRSLFQPNANSMWTFASGLTILTVILIGPWVGAPCGRVRDRYATSFHHSTTSISVLYFLNYLLNRLRLVCSAPQQRVKKLDWSLLGGYAFIDSRHPHFAGSRASLTSDILPATITNSQSDNALCFVFWVHMFGAGIGSLRYLI